MRKLAVAFAVFVAVALVLGQSCSTSGPTDPGPTVVSQATPAPPVVPAGAPVPAPTADPEQGLSYVVFNSDGSGQFCALAKGGKTAYLSYTKPLETDPIYGTLAVSAEVGKCAPIPPAKEIVKACGKLDVQIDANQDGVQAGRHIGHKIVRDLEATLTCCVDKWAELEPEITYSEWGECKPVENAESRSINCSQSRTKTTVIKEKNSCTQEIREKSRKTETESRPCECACVPEWKELPPDITYGEWGECKPVETFVEPSCAQARTKTTVIKEQNTCTKEIREKSRTSETESKSCECQTTCKIIIPEVSASGIVLPHVCPDHPYGDPDDECEAFGLVYQGKDDFAQYTASQDARLAIVKAGGCYTYFENVRKGDSMATWDSKTVSHVTYCKCP